MESEEVNYHPDIDNWPYIGEGNILGGGGRHQDADIVVPPTANLYGSGLDSVPGYSQAKSFFMTPYPLVIGLLVGFALGFIFVKYKVDAKATAAVKKVVK